LTDYFEANKDQQYEEQWPVGNIYTNHWAAPTRMLSVENKKLRGGGFNFKQAIWDAAQSTIEDWTGMELTPTSLYGIRCYTEGSILSPHVDRLPLVSSAIVNVAQDVDEDWILEVIDRQGKAVNVTMQPGDMVLYESGSLIHGRPYPLKGRYYCNVFIHFEPTGRTLPLAEDDLLSDHDSFFPPYILEGSPEISNWQRNNPHGWKVPSPSGASVGVPEGHIAAAVGDLNTLRTLDKRKLKHKDRNGWEPIHEASRAGHKHVLEYLVQNGADVNVRTHGGTGPTPLNLAKEFLGKNHPVTEYLESLGAVDVGPEL
jgi:hypothetical protein